MISKKQIEDEGKAQYAKWRSNKDKVNMLQAEQAVFTGQEIKVARLNPGQRPEEPGYWLTSGPDRAAAKENITAYDAELKTQYKQDKKEGKTGLNEKWYQMKYNNPEEYKEKLDTLVNMNYKLFEGQAEKYKSHFKEDKIREEMRKEFETKGNIDFKSRAKKFKESIPKGSSFTYRDAQRLSKKREQQRYNTYLDSGAKGDGQSFEDWKHDYY